MRCVLCMLEAVEGDLCLLEVPEVMRCMLLCMLDAVKGGLSFGVSKFPFVTVFLLQSAIAGCPPQQRRAKCCAHINVPVLEVCAACDGGCALRA